MVKNWRYIIIAFCLLWGTKGFFQNNNVPTQSINNQFENIFRNASNAEGFKVVNASKLQLLQKNLSDTLSLYKQKIESLTANNNTLNKTVETISAELNTLKDSLTQKASEQKEDTLFGINKSSSNFTALLASIFGVLLLLLIFFIYRFTKSNTVTKETLLKYNDLEKEFEKHRQTALEKEQQLTRKLFDAVKNKKKD